MEEKRTLIETFLPVEEISAEAKKEKSGWGKPNTFYMHFWWTRKPLIAARSTILGALLPEDFDLSEFKRLIGLRDNQKIRAHKFDLSEEKIKSLKNEISKIWDYENIEILDPFGGGGSIPFEALRLDLDVVSNDYNPVAYIIQKATLEYPRIYGSKLIEDIKIGFEEIIRKTENELGYLYPLYDNKEVNTYIYSWVTTCPHCGFKNPLVGQWWLVNKPKKKIFLKPSVIEKKLELELCYGNKAPKGTVVNGSGRCLNCGETISNKHIKEDIAKNEEELLIAVVTSEKKGKGYYLPNEKDFEALRESEKLVNKNMDAFISEDLITIEEMPMGDIRSARYLKYWYRMLNKRQLILFTTLIKNIRIYIATISESENKEYVKALATYFSLILGKHIDYNCRSTKYNRPAESISSITSLRRPSMLWDHTETNPFSDSSGTFKSAVDAILDGLRYSLENLKINSTLDIQNKSITELSYKVPIIVTDPPYFDDVQYAELSEIFYVFEKRALDKVLDLPKNVPSAEDLSVSKKRKKEQFEYLFEISCKKMYSFLQDNGLLVMYFAHSSIEAWDFVVKALQKSNFRITATWPLHTESPTNQLAKGKASILSSIVIVARKRKEEKSGFIEDIKDEIEVHIKKRLNKFWKYGLRGADLTVGAMGASLDILTQYSEIKSITGKITVTDILELVEVYVAEYVLEKFIKDSESLDSASRFYIYCRLIELDEMSFDTANLISKTLNIDIMNLESRGLLESYNSKQKKGIKLLKFDERDTIEIKSIIDAVHMSMISYDRGGMKEFETLINESPYSKSDIFNILSSFQYLDSKDSEKQIAMQILGKSADAIPEKGQSTLDAQ